MWHGLCKWDVTRTPCAAPLEFIGDNDRESDKNNQPPTRPGITNKPFVSSYDAERNIRPERDQRLTKAWPRQGRQHCSRTASTNAKQESYLDSQGNLAA